VDVEVRGIGVVLATLRKVAEVDPRGVLEEIGMAIHRRVLEGFEHQSDPWGRPWKPLSPETIEKKRSSRILEDTGRLRQSFAWRLLGRDAVVVGTNVEYALFHQYGTRRGLPKRPMLPLDEHGVHLPGEWMKEIERILERHYGFPD